MNKVLNKIFCLFPTDTNTIKVTQIFFLTKSHYLSSDQKNLLLYLLVLLLVIVRKQVS